MKLQHGDDNAMCKAWTGPKAVFLGFAFFPKSDKSLF